MPKQAHQIVGHHDEAEGGFRGPEVLQAERVESEVLLQLFDPVLAVRTAVIDLPDLVQRQVEVGHIQAEAVVGQGIEEQRS